MTTDQLNKLVKTSHPDTHCQAFNDTFAKFSIDTYLRQCHFVSQVLHESGNLKYFQEIASGIAYEGRKDLGNMVKGWGVKYKGRGPLMVTGHENYYKFNQWLQMNGYHVDVEKDPQLLEQQPYAMLSAGWFWSTKKINALADKDNCFRVSARINGINKKLATKEYPQGQPNHLYERRALLERVKAVLYE